MPNVVSPIPGRLHAVDVDGIVTGADEIFDDDLNIRQSEVNTAIERPYNSTTPNGMGRIVLKKNKTFAEQVTQSDTIYIIQYDFELTSDVTIPANCVLEFDGGSISGSNNLTLQETYITGSPLFDCNIAGSIKNDMFNVLWIKSGDLGAKVNKAAGTFSNILIPNGDYVFTTPININGVKKLISNANLKYDGTYLNNEGIFKIRAWGAYIYIHRLEPNDRSVIDYLDTRTTNAVGLEIQSCNQCEVHVMNMQYFNENLRVSDINHNGCCYNKFFIGVLASANANIRLYQHDSPNGISWTNENLFVGGRLTHWTDSRQWGEYWNVAVGGPQIDKPSYAIPGAVDSENTVNGLTFIGTSIESNRVTMLLYNVTDSQFIGMRQETNPGFAKIIGNFTNIYYVPKFAGNTNILAGDITEAKMISFTNPEEICYCKKTIIVDENIAADGKLVGYSGYLCNTVGIASLHINYLTHVGAIVEGKFIRASLNKASRIYAIFLDSNNVNITNDYNTEVIGYQIAYNSTYKAFLSTTDIMYNDIRVPAGVSKVFIGADSGSNLTLNIMSAGKITTPQISINGTTANRPIALPTNVPYYNTDKGINEYWNGSSWEQRIVLPPSDFILNHLTENDTTLNNKFVAHNCYLADATGLKFGLLTSYLTLKGCVLDTTNINDKEVKATTDISLRFMIMFLDNNNSNISEDYKNTVSFDNFAWHANMKCFYTTTDRKSISVIGIPSDVTKVFLGINTDTYPTKMTVTHNKVSINTLPTVGAYADKPVGLPKGVPYFATDIIKNVYYTGDTSGGKSGWIDSLGNEPTDVYPKVIGTPTAGNLVKFNSTDTHNIEDAGIAPQV